MLQILNEELLFVPLGGCGEIGMNLNLYGFGTPPNHAWLMIDLGIGFARGSIPGVDVVMPDPTYILGHKDRLVGLVLTHAHEDHLGAVPYLWPQLQCPVYGSAFALSVLRRKLAGTDLEGRVPVHEVSSGQPFDLGPFNLKFVGLTHSIPEAHAVVIRTPAGTVLHTGDWTFDPDPVVGAVSDIETLRNVGNEGVLAMVCDSTNVFEAGASDSEGSLLETLTDLVGRCANRVVVSCFSSNIARLSTIASAAAANGRDVIIAGASLRRNHDSARECGYLHDIAPFLEESAFGYLPRERCLVVSTGSQGEPNAVLARIASDTHASISLDSGDTVIFSSRVIPGNEASIGRLQNQLMRQGIEVITQRDAPVHVSGHPARDELARMYSLVRPRLSVPVHGELRHMIAHAELARSCQIPEAIVAENGTVVRLAPEAGTTSETVPAGRWTAEGKRLVPIDGNLVRQRTRAVYQGAAFVTVVLNADGRLAAPPELSTLGLLESDDDRQVAAICEAIGKNIDQMLKTTYNDDDAVSESVRLTVRRAFRDIIGKKPTTHVHLIRV